MLPRRCTIGLWFLLGWVCLLPVHSADSDVISPPPLSDDARASAEKGIALFQAEKFADARAEFLRVTELAPQHPMGWLNLGSAEYRLGDLEAAETHLEKASRLDPSQVQAWLTLGIIDYQKSNLDAGLAALSRAAYLDPKNATVHLYLGVLVRRKGWWDGAEDELRKAVEFDPNYAEAHFNLAVLYLEHQPQAIELARRHYLRALKLGTPPDPAMDRVLKRVPEQ